MDGIVIHALVQELKELIGAKINKIHQISPHEIIWQIRNKGQNYKLYFSAHPVYARLHLTERTYENPLEPPMFCMLLRKHLEQGIIEAIEQVSLERIVHIDVKHFDELGDVRYKRLIFECMGRHSNLVLVDREKQTIYDGIHHVTPAVSSYRVVMPGVSYMPPPIQTKLNVLETTNVDWHEKLNQQQYFESANWQALIDSFVGFSPSLAKAIDANGQPRIIESLQRLKQELLNHKVLLHKQLAYLVLKEMACIYCVSFGQ